MDLINYNPSKTAAWKRLKKHAEQRQINIQQQLQLDKARVSDFSVRQNELFLDFSKNLIDRDIWADLLDLAEKSPLSHLQRAMFSGEKVNLSENRAVLHTLLRANDCDASGIRDVSKLRAVRQQQKRMKEASDDIREGNWVGRTGQAITDVVNIGIGGSDLGPKLTCNALSEFSHAGIRMHFVGNVDGADILSLLKTLNPDTTLILVASKTFTTQETMMNYGTVIKWFENSTGLKDAQRTDHLIAITANRDKALKCGFKKSNILEFGEWVGGRYSLWSSIGFSIAICIGYDKFKEMLDGARELDQHFQTAPFHQNIPIILALLSVWYSSFMKCQTHAVIPYCERLQLLPPYLQQLEMESNGKSISRDGQPIDYPTSPIIWGQTGTNSQHAFFQLLHQGTHTVPIDFLAAANDSLSNDEHHRVLLGNMLAQGSALMVGQSAPTGEPHHKCPGNRPSNALILDRLSAKNFGALIAVYEHKVFAEGCIWNINSFDQWGVEIGKKITGQILLKGHSNIHKDPSTDSLIGHLGKL